MTAVRDVPCSGSGIQNPDNSGPVHVRRAARTPWRHRNSDRLSSLPQANLDKGSVYRFQRDRVSCTNCLPCVLVLRSSDVPPTLSTEWAISSFASSVVCLACRPCATCTQTRTTSAKAAARRSRSDRTVAQHRYACLLIHLRTYRPGTRR